MDQPSAAVEPKKKKAPVTIGCDQCRRRKTKCDQASPTCGPCIYAGLLECTFLLGKTPAPRRKKSQKSQSEVEILEARLETIESAYTERLNQMEQLLNSVMPSHGQVPIADTASKPPQGSASTAFTGNANLLQHTSLTDDKDWGIVPKTDNNPQSAPRTWSQSNAAAPMPHRNTSSLSPPQLASTLSPKNKPPKPEAYDTVAQVPTSRGTTISKSPASSLTRSLKSTKQEDSNDEYDDHVGDLADTMDKLRLFDASLYLGKGTMLFTSTDQNKFWDEEISFDVHDSQDIDIPPEGFVMPPVEVIDALFDVYFNHYHVFLPMLQKTTLLQALEDRYEPQSIFLLNSVFMAAALTGDYQHASCYSDPNNKKTLATPFFERARMVLDYCIGIPRVSTVQGLLLLSQYPKISGWGHHYIQQAILMAADLGLHRKCDRWIPDKQVQETRKRVFWCVYAIDSYTASVTGRRPLIDDNEIDVSLLVPTSAEGEEEYSNTLFLVHICKLWRIFRNVKRYIFNSTEVQEMVPGSLPKTYEQQLIQWQLQLPAALQFSFDVKEDDPHAMFNARGGVAQLLYECTLILLHQPYLSSSQHGKSSPYRSQDICLKAASKITDISKVIIRTYSRTFEVSGVPEYAMTNAVRIQVMYMKSEDAQVAKESVANFDYLIQFFREYYSSPRANIDEQNINCILSFFDEFMHSVKGLSESTVHICATAIKSLAIAKRKKIALGRSCGGGHTHHPIPKGGDDRPLSHLVKIGRQERAKVRGSASMSPLSHTLNDFPSQHRKRHSQMDREEQLRFLPSPYLLQTQPGSSLSPSPSILEPDDDDNCTHSGKIQKVSQFIGPFGGPLVVESLNQYQTSTAILNQPRALSAIPDTQHHMSAADQVFQAFNVQQQQQQFQQQQQQHQQQSPHQHIYQHHEQQHHQQDQQPSQNSGSFIRGQDTTMERSSMQPQHQQGYHYQSSTTPFHQNIMTMMPASDSQPTFWGNLGSAGDSSLTQNNMMETVQGIPHSSMLSSTRLQGGLSGNSGSSDILGSTPPSLFGGMMSSDFQGRSMMSQTPAMFMPTTADSTEIGGHGHVQDEALSADQIQAMLEQTVAEDTHTHNHLGQGRPVEQQQQQQQPPSGSAQRVDFSFHNDFQPSSWQGMM